MNCQSLNWGEVLDEFGAWTIRRCEKPAQEYIKMSEYMENRISQKYVLCGKCVNELGLLERGFRRVDEVLLP